jgi:O-antigen ligase
MIGKCIRFLRIPTVALQEHPLPDHLYGQAISILDNVAESRTVREVLGTYSFNIRLVFICFAAASVGLSMALISIAKLLLFLVGIFSLLKLRPMERGQLSVNKSYVPALVLAILAVCGASLLWTTGPISEALNSLGKYGKLLVIAILVATIRTRAEAAYAMLSFLALQSLLVLGSWALFFGIPVPWATSNMALTQFSVFSSYLDQGIMGAVTAAVLWHLRTMAKSGLMRNLATASAAISMINVLFVMQGRSGHVVAIALLSLAIMWELPKKVRLLVVFLPFVLVAILYVSSDRVNKRLNEVVSEVQAFSPGEQMNTSSGIRLSLWLRATGMIASKPLTGYGLGNWNTQYNIAQKSRNTTRPVITTNYNTHQEYLQWGIQLGLPGILLLLGLMGCIGRDALRMSTPVSRATFSVLAAFAIACLFNSSLHDAYIGDFFCVAFGLLIALGLPRNDRLTMMPKAATPAGAEG